MSIKKIHILGMSGHAGQKHREAIEQLQGLYSLSSYEEADIIDICTPNYKHLPDAHHALTTGNDCIIEKPICNFTPDLLHLCDVEDHENARAYPVLQYRNTDILSYHCIWQRSPDYYAGWRGKYRTALGGVILSHGIHLIDHAICQYGRVACVECETWSDPRYACEVETKAEIQLVFSGGRSRSIHLEISPDKPTFAPANPGYLDFFRNLDKAPRLSEIYHLQEVLDACYAASRSSSIITLSSAALTA
jgi:predicted dehydrogenase